MLRCNLCRYADAYILGKGTTTITGAGDDDAAKQLDERNKSVIFKNCATKCISRINGTEIEYVQDTDIVMPMYNVIEWKNLWKNYKDDPNDNITQSESFKSKIKITVKAPAVGNTKNLEIAVPLKYLSNFRTIIEVNLILTWS